MKPIDEVYFNLKNEVEIWESQIETWDDVEVFIDDMFCIQGREDYIRRALDLANEDLQETFITSKNK